MDTTFRDEAQLIAAGLVFFQRLCECAAFKPGEFEGGVRQMLFNSISFLLFFIVFYSVYLCLQGRKRLFFLLVASWIFYGMWDWRFLGGLIGSTLGNFWLGQIIDRSQSNSARRMALQFGVAGNLAVLGFFKYFNFFVDSAAELLSIFGLKLDFVTASILLPVGISFYTFHHISYIVDIYRRAIKSEPGFANYAAYIALFPHLVAGPIVRAKDLLPQIKAMSSPTRADFFKGAELALWGFFLKMCLADNAVMLVDAVFAKPEIFDPASRIMAVLAFSFQIYGDFAGYSLIAIGLARMMGFDFGRNFDAPYFSASFGNFWQRWHISLSSWLRDYLFIPLGGSRCGRLKTFRNLLVTMLLGGLWHGASWVFVIWGGLHGFFLVLERIVGPAYWQAAQKLKVRQAMARLPAVAAVFSLTCFAGLFFRAENLTKAMAMMNGLLDFSAYRVPALLIGPGGLLALGLVILTLLVEGCGRLASVRGWYENSLILRLAGCYALFFAILLFGVFGGSRFIYFQF